MAAPVLLEPDRKRLDGIVGEMVANGEPDENIRFVVSDFKKKYAKAPSSGPTGIASGAAIGAMGARQQPSALSTFVNRPAKAPQAPQKRSVGMGLPELASRVAKGETVGKRPKFHKEVEAIIAASPKMTEAEKKRLRRLGDSPEMSYITEGLPPSVPPELALRLKQEVPRSQERQVRESGIALQADDPTQIGSTLSEIGGDVAEMAGAPRILGEMATFVNPLSRLPHAFQAGQKIAGGDVLQGGFEAIGTILPDVPLGKLIPFIQKLHATSGFRSAQAVEDAVNRITAEFNLTKPQAAELRKALPRLGETTFREPGVTAVPRGGVRAPEVEALKKAEDAYVKANLKTAMERERIASMRNRKNRVPVPPDRKAVEKELRQQFHDTIGPQEAERIRQQAVEGLPKQGMTPEEIEASRLKLGIQEVPSASKVKEAAEVHGNVRPQPRQGQGQVPPESRGAGVRPEAQEEQIGIKNAAIDAERAAEGKPKVEHPLGGEKSWEETLREADKGYDPDKYHRALKVMLDKSEKDSRKALPAFNEAQQSQMAKHLGGIKQSIREKNAQIVKMEDAGGDSAALRSDLDKLRKLEDESQRANYLVGTTSGRALNIRKLTADLKDYSPSEIELDLKARDKGVRSENVTRGKQVGEDIQRLTAETDNLRPKAAQEAANTFFDAVKRSRPGPKATIQERRRAALGNIKATGVQFLKDAQSKANLSLGGVKITADAAKYLWKISPDVYQLARTYIDEGMVNFDEVVKRIRGDLQKEGIELSDDEVHRIFAGEVDRLPRTQSEVEQAMRELKRQAKGTVGAQQAELARRIKVYQDILKSGTLPRRRPAPAPYADELLSKEIELRARKAEVDYLRGITDAEKKWKDMTGLEKGWHGFHNFTRSSVAGLDLSYPLNQGAFPLLAHPYATWKMLQDMKSVVSHRTSADVRKDMFRIFGDIRNNSHYEEAVTGGLDLFKGNEIFTSGPNKLWGFSHAEAAYEVAAARQRMEVFSNLVDMQQKDWFGGLIKGRKMSLKDFEMTAEAVNVMTGVGVGKAAQGLKALNKYSPVQLFAPGYFVSRLQLAAARPAIKAIWNGNHKLAALIVKDYAMFATQTAGMLGALQALGAEVNTDDPASPDWMKAKFGDTTVDLSGGILGAMKYFNLAMDGQWDKIPNSFLFQLKGKLAPTGRLAVGLMEGTSYGKSIDMTPEGLANIILSFAPIFSQNAKEIWESKDLDDTQKAALTVIALLGGNVSARQAPDKGR